MAKYIKFNFTSGDDLSIEINDIESVSYIDANTTQIDLNNGISKFTITHGSALEATVVVEAVYAAMMAQTVGVYSTVKGPISVAQVVDSSSGRQLITTREKNVTFTSYVFETVPVIEERFVIQVKTDNTGTSNNDQFTLPWTLNSTYDVDWGDGNTDTGLLGTVTHTYSSAGTYDIKVTATTGKIYFNDGGDKEKLLDIKNWGTCEWTSMQEAFEGCVNLTGSFADTPNLSSVSSFQKTFRNCTVFNGDVTSWDVSNATDLSAMFQGCKAFDQNIGTWDVSNVTTIRGMLGGYGSASPMIFNNGGSDSIKNWNTASLIDAREMQSFVNAIFDQPLTNWDISNVTMFDNFLVTGIGLSISNYNETLVGWAAQTPQSNININFGGSQYTLGGAAEAARNTLINTYNWT